MNSIRRPRNRPRVKSVNFRSLWWLVTLEAAFNIRWPDLPAEQAAHLRETLAGAHTNEVRQRAELVLHFNEARRYYP